MTHTNRIETHKVVPTRDIPENPESALAVQKEKMSEEELRRELRKQYGYGKWADRMIDEEIRNREAVREFVMHGVKAANGA